MSVDERQTRLQKIEKLKELGINPFADKFLPREPIKRLINIGKDVDKTFDQLTSKDESLRTSGRLISLREHGKISFGKIKDFTGEIQLMFYEGAFELYSGDEKIISISPYQFIKKMLDIGDFIGVEWQLFRTKHGELTIFVQKLFFLSKAVRPLPEKFHWLSTDKEDRYRYRYLDLLTSSPKWEQKDLDFLKKDSKFKSFFKKQISSNAELQQILDKILSFRSKKLDDEKLKKLLKEFKTTQDLFKNIDHPEVFEYFFDLFTKSEKFRNALDQSIKEQLPAHHLAMHYRMSTMDRFLVRAKVVKFIREYLEKHKFVEVETPVLINKASWALAKPFVTHHNALDMDVYLRIAPETYLKRAIVGGFERVYEFARCFRNEWIDPSHLQDFTMLEFYWARVDFEFLMDFTEKMFKDLIKNIFGTLRLLILDKEGNPVEINFDQPWPRKTIFELIEPFMPQLEELWQQDKLEEAKKIFKQNFADQLDKDELREIDKLWWGNFIDFVYKKTARKQLIDPVFVIRHPIELSPLARQSDQNPKVVDRFQLVVNWWEIVNAYSELIDPKDQLQRFLEQSKLKQAGDEEAHEIDLDYVKAMEYWMPPMAWWGSGIDRLVALLTTQENIRDVVMFPLLKPDPNLPKEFGLEDDQPSSE